MTGARWVFCICMIACVPALRERMGARRAMDTMTAAANRGEPRRLADASRDAHGWRARRSADRYSRRVAILKRVLPTIGVALLLLVAAWPRLAPLLDSVRFGFPAIDLREARELKMLKPRYAGIDRYDRPYVVTAAVGRQVPNHSNLMSLEQPRARLTAHGGAKVVLTAATGIYQSQTELLDLFGKVTLTHQNGTRFVTRQAHADFSDNTAEGHDPIEGHGPSGDVWGQGFRVLDKGDTIIFTGRSRVVLKGSRPDRPTPPPAALPPAIAETAAQLAAAAAASPFAAGSFGPALSADPSPADPTAPHSAAANPASPANAAPQRVHATAPGGAPPAAAKAGPHAG
jgi:lipopolysaccharide export system protein LptC